LIIVYPTILGDFKRFIYYCGCIKSVVKIQIQKYFTFSR